MSTIASRQRPPIRTNPRFRLILGEEDWRVWLGQDDHGSLADLLKPYPAEEMTAWPIGPRVGNVRNNDRALIDPFE